MEYQILVTTSRRTVSGGVSVVQTVLKFSGKGVADTAFEKIEQAAKHDEYHNTEAIKLY